MILDPTLDMAPYTTRHVLSWHYTDAPWVSAVVVTWHRDRYTRVRQSLRTYPARSTRGAWSQLWMHGHITHDVWLDEDAYRAFVMLGNASVGS